MRSMYVYFWVKFWFFLQKIHKIQFLHIRKFSSAASCAKGSDESPYMNKKDGYRQQNVRQRQKLISIIDYDVCITFY